MKMITVLLALLVELIILLSACASKAAPIAAPSAPAPQAAPSAPAAPAPARAAWEEEWEKLVEGAKKEGTVVVICTAGGELRAALMRAFKEKYGISTEIISARGGEISERIGAERRAGIYATDVYLGGSTTIVNQLKPSHILDPLEPQLLLPEVLDGKMWWNGELPWIDRNHTALSFLAYPSPPMAINTELVKAGEIKSYRDLLAPKWKGKIEMNDPTIAGSGLKWFGVISSMIMDLDFVRELAKQEPVFLRDERLLGEWLARGKYAVWIGIKSEVVNYYRQAGAPVNYLYPIEGVYVSPGSGNAAILNRAPHPKAAKVFINWVLSREGQTIFSKAVGQQSGRIDVPTDHLDSLQVRKPATKYYFADYEEFLVKQPEQAKVAKEIFGHLIK